MELLDIFKAAIQKGASDIHFVINRPPFFRVNGELLPQSEFPAVTPDECKRMLMSILTDSQRARFEENWDLDLSLDVEGLARFRANLLRQRNGVEGVFRLIATKIPGPEELDLPAVIVQWADLPRGLVLVTGPTGSGKSTTLACLIERINERRAAHLLTLEDPIEFIYPEKKCVVRQREIGQQAKTYAAALKHALRQDPDVILVGELRDLETISAALTLAETGHLVLATLHTTDAAQTVDRIVDVFPAYQQQQVRVQLAGVLKGVVSQVLLPRKDGKGGRVAAREIMVVTPAISNLIREGKSHQIYSAIDTGLRSGMISLDKALGDLAKKGVISMEEALSKANRPELVRGSPPASSAG